MEPWSVAFPMVGAHSVAYLFVHLVWATRERRDVITPLAERRLGELLRGKAIACRCVLHAFGAASDHVHVIVQHPPTLSIAELAGALKGASSRAMRARLAWQNGYWAESLARSALPELGRYVTGQRERHARGATRREWELPHEAGGLERG